MTTLAVVMALVLAPAGDAGPITVDRIVDGEWGVLEVAGDTLAFADVPAVHLPAGTREGARLTLTMAGGD